MTTIVINGHKIDDSTTFEYRNNPKRSGSKAHARYELYQAATNLAEYTTICEDNEISKYAKADLRYDTEKLHLILLDADGNMMNAPEAQQDKDDAQEKIDEDENTETDEVTEVEDVESDEEMEEFEETIDEEFDEDAELEEDELDDFEDPRDAEF